MGGFAKYWRRMKGNSINDRIDQSAGFEVTLEAGHHAIHRGWGFSLSHIFSSVANGATVNYAFQTPTSDAGYYVHTQAIILSATNNNILYTLYENPTTPPSGGSDITPYNRNRNSSTTSRLQALKSEMTIDTTGAIVLDSRYISNVGSTNVIETVFKPNTWYIRTFTNSTGGASNISVFTFWYERPNANTVW